MIEWAVGPVVVLDESGAVVLPGATVVLRWTDAERMPLREAVDANGRIVVAFRGMRRGRCCGLNSGKIRADRRS